MTKRLLLLVLLFAATPVFADFVFPAPRAFPAKIVLGSYSHSGNTEATAFTVDVRDGAISQVTIALDLSNLTNSVTVRVFQAIDGTLRRVDEETITMPSANNAGYNQTFITSGDMAVTLDSVGNETPAKDVPFAHAVIRFR